MQGRRSYTSGGPRRSKTQFLVSGVTEVLAQLPVVGRRATGGGCTGCCDWPATPTCASTCFLLENEREYLHCFTATLLSVYYSISHGSGNVFEIKNFSPDFLGFF